ncbi:MAG: alpha-amylase family glycosyl hydrolase [Ignavibacteriaceae bacterium]
MRLKFVIFLTFFVCSTFAQQVVIKNKDAEIWKSEQVIKGKLDSFLSSNGTLYLNNSPINFNVSQVDSSFEVSINADEDINNIYAIVDNNGTPVFSDTIQYTLRYKPIQEVYAYAEVTGPVVDLKAQVVDNPKNEALSFSWSADEKNPLALIINNSNDSSANISLPSELPLGEYYFDLLTIDQSGDSIKARTYFTSTKSGIKPFNIKTDHAEWIDSAVIYEITPYNFVIRPTFRDITNKIPELASFGITTIWLQPVYSTYYGGQGYDITDYFTIRNDLGPEDQLKELIQTAKSYGLKVIFDFVPNHSSIKHRYAQNSIQFGTDSHYWDFYQREEDIAPYSQHYHHYQGFINYFWDDLPNLNYDNPEVKRWITEAAKYWIKKYDIDGYRFDAVWGVNARNPEFTKELRLELKRLKPEILMLAEDKATVPSVFDERFDVAYDWFPEEDWVSHWVWQLSYSTTGNPTIFNSGGVNNRSSQLRKSLNNNGNGFASNSKILRFMENNDQFHFITHHGLERTKMAAALMFSLDGVPLIYNGQEIGIEGHPYETENVFSPGPSIQSKDQYGLFPYYHRLIELRKSLPSLYSKNFKEISANPNGYVFAYRRWLNDQNIFGVINMSGGLTPVNLSLPIDEMNLDSTKTYYLTDMLNGEVISGIPQDLNTINVSVEGYTTRLFLFADTAMTVTGVKTLADANIPQEFKLEQNYPNPFNPSTSILYSVSSKQFIFLKVYDILGKEVATLVNKEQQPGNYKVEFSANQLSSGIYFYQLNAGNFSQTKKMILLK